jgi:hypothetical protein
MTVKIVGISRDAENEKVLILVFDAKPTDREMRIIHETLRTIREHIRTSPPRYDGGPDC